MTPSRRSGPRDSQGRREAIIWAAVQVIAEHGLVRTTHRRIADRAGVPLGSTTYYFATLDDLVAAALHAVADAYVADVDRWQKALEHDPDPHQTLVGFAEHYLSDTATAVVEYELYVAAAREARLRPVARAWVDQVREVLTPIAGARAARTVTMLVDGAMLQSLVLDEPLDRDGLAAALRTLLA